MIDTKDIRQRLSNNTAIDAKEIQALCDEVESLRVEVKNQDKAISGLITYNNYITDRLLKDLN